VKKELRGPGCILADTSGRLSDVGEKGGMDPVIHPVCILCLDVDGWTTRESAPGVCREVWMYCWHSKVQGTASFGGVGWEQTGDVQGRHGQQGVVLEKRGRTREGRRGGNKVDE
jgi:hypothetical protein